MIDLFPSQRRKREGALELRSEIGLMELKIVKWTSVFTVGKQNTMEAAKLLTSIRRESLRKPPLKIFHYGNEFRCIPRAASETQSATLVLTAP